MTGRPPPAWTLFTLGYERASFAEFLAALQAAGVGAVIDVRDLPLSRRAGLLQAPAGRGPGRGRDRLPPSEGARHPQGGGGPAHRQGDMARFWALVDARLATPEADHALAYAGALATERPACLMCFEADHRICHRDRVAALLVSQDRLQA